MTQVVGKRMVAVSGSSRDPHKAPLPESRGLTSRPTTGKQTPLDSVRLRGFPLNHVPASCQLQPELFMRTKNHL